MYWQSDFHGDIWWPLYMNQIMRCRVLRPALGLVSCCIPVLTIWLTGFQSSKSVLRFQLANADCHGEPRGLAGACWRMLARWSTGIHWSRTTLSRTTLWLIFCACSLCRCVHTSTLHIYDYLCIMERPCPALECSLPPDSRHFKSCENCWAGTGP